MDELRRVFAELAKQAQESERMRQELARFSMRCWINQGPARRAQRNREAALRAIEVGGPRV